MSNITENNNNILKIGLLNANGLTHDAIDTAKNLVYMTLPLCRKSYRKRCEL